MRVFITGVSSGIGNELARVLLHDGHEVWGIARGKDMPEQARAGLEQDGFRYLSCDLMESGQMDRVLDAMKEASFLPDVVILNAAVETEDVYPGIDFENAQRMMRTNVDGAAYWVSAFIDDFLERGSGQFIGISSILAHWPDTSTVAYSASKAAMTMFLRGCRLRYAHRALKFKIIYLGPVDTGINPRFADQPPSKSMLVASPKDTALFIRGAIRRSQSFFYYPLYIFAVFTFLRWLPDRVFEFLTKHLKR
jgi:short-subunit dehydrogenase